VVGLVVPPGLRGQVFVIGEGIITEGGGVDVPEVILRS
jgi:hypothetical protein